MVYEEKFIVVRIGPFDVELVPKPNWGKKVSSILGDKKWREVRKRELERAGHACEICGYRGESRELVCHEVWRYDDLNFIQKLVGYKIVCRKCSLIYHMGYAASEGLADEAVRHFSKLTKVDINQARAFLNSGYRMLMSKWKERSRHEWRMDISLETAAPSSAS